MKPSNNLIIWLLIGILIRLLIIPFTYHPDINFFVLTNYLLVIKQLWLGIYDFAGSSMDLAHLQPPTAFTYPPLIFLINGLFANLLYPFQNLNFVRDFLLDSGKHLTNPQTYWLLFLTKIPYLIPDLLTGYFLSQLVKPNLKQLAWKLWLLNPVTLYATFAIGQFDIYPTLATVIAVWLAAKQKPYLAALTLGIGGAFKVFPLLFLPILVLHQGKTWTQKILLILTGFATHILPLIPYLPSSGFRTYALLAPQTEKMLFAKIPLTGAEYLSIFVVIYTLIILFSVNKTRPLWHYFFVVLLLFFSVTHFHPQWFVWLSPWLILFYIDHPATRWAIYLLLFCYLIIILSFESSLNYGLISPLIHSLNNAPPLTNMLPGRLDTKMYLSIVRSIFAGVSLYIVTSLFKTPQTKS